MKAILIKVDGTEEEVVPKEGTTFDLQELQGYVEGFIQLVPLTDGRMMVVNEEGVPLKLKFNDKATKMPHKLLVDGGLRGDVVVCNPEMLE